MTDPHDPQPTPDPGDHAQGDSGLSDERLLAAAFGEGDDAERRSVEELAAGSSEIAERLRSYRQTVERLREAETFTADASALQRAQAIFDSAPAGGAMSGDQIIAQLAVGEGGFVAGLRSSVESSDFVELEAGGYRVSLRQSPAPARGGSRNRDLWRLRGALEPPSDYRSARIVARPIDTVGGAAERESVITQLDYDGRFVLTLRAGVYDLVIEAPAGTADGTRAASIMIPGIEVG